MRSDIYSLGVIMREMFGASAIAKRCTAALPARRYANVEALQKAWSARSLKYYILAAAVSLVLLLLPSLFYLNDKVKENADAGMRQQFLMQIEADVEIIYESIAYDISDEVYLEFANNCIISYWDSIYSYRDRVLQSVDDPELNLLAKNALLQKSMSCCEKLQSAAEHLPLFSENVSDVKELRYYCALIAERRPFVPYPGEQ